MLAQVNFCEVPDVPQDFPWTLSSRYQDSRQSTESRVTREELKSTLPRNEVADRIHVRQAPLLADQLDPNSHRAAHVIEREVDHIRLQSHDHVPCFRFRLPVT